MKYLVIHLKRYKNGSELCPVGILLTYLKAGESYPRFIEHRGITDTSVARRPAMPDEIAECDNPYRTGFAAIYDDWEKLIEDEMSFTIPDDWIDKLRQLQKQYPQFKAKPQLQLL
jgi:hypothetical protein